MTDLDPKNLPQLIVDGETFYKLPDFDDGSDTVLMNTACKGCSLFDEKTYKRKKICQLVECRDVVYVRPADLDRYKSLAVLQKLRV